MFCKIRTYKNDRRQIEIVKNAEERGNYLFIINTNLQENKTKY